MSPAGLLTSSVRIIFTSFKPSAGNPSRSHRILFSFPFAEALPSPATLKLFYYNATNKASPPKLLDLTSNFTDYSPFGEFTIATLNTALSAIGVAPVSGASPLISLVKGNNLLGAWISTTGAATVGLITDDPNVGPPPDVIEEDSYLTEINNTPGVFASATLSNANGTLSVINNGDGTYSYEFFSQFATGPFNRTIIFPESLSLVAASSFGYPTPVVNFRFTGRDWIRAASDIGTEGTFTAIDLQKGLKRARATPGSSVPLYAQLSVSDINGNYLNYGTFDPAFDVVVDAAPVVVPSPSPSPKPSKSPKPSPKPAPKPAPKPKRI
jgi:hypothetical protein